MSRWTKGELSIGEIAQMERNIIEALRHLEDASTFAQTNGATSNYHIAKVLKALIDTVNLILKG